MRTLLLCLCLCLVIVSNFQAQEFPEIIPPSPTSVGLGKYGAYPVNYSTGVPSIEIPLYEIKVGTYSLPVKLSYHGSGIKVSEEASWVGLGWSLFYGGSLTRTVYGLPDDEGGYLDAPLLNVTDIQDFMQEDPYNFSYMSTLALPWNYASTPDIYHFAINGGESGMFMIDRNSNIQLFPPKPIQIHQENVPLDILGAYQIVDKNGIVFDFGLGDHTKEKTHIVHPFGAPNNYIYESTWHLSKITIPNGKKINFDYQADGILDQKNTNAQHYSITEKKCPEDNPTDYENCNAAYTIQEGTYENISTMDYVEVSKLEKIVFPEGRLIFHFGAEKRQDLAAVNGHELNCLSRIDVQKKNNEGTYDNIQSILFQYSYFEGGSSPIPSNNKRLRLDQVSRINYSDDTVEIIALFEYNDTNLPAKDSFSIDYFGYHNDANNSNLIPKHYKRFSDGSYREIGTSNRQVNPNAIHAYTLTSITYPTKGKTEFVFEPNQYYGSDIFEDFQEVQESASLLGAGDGEQQPEGLLLEENYCVDESYDLCNDCCIKYEHINFTLQEQATIALDFIRTNSNELDHWDKYSFGQIRLLHNGENILATLPGIWGGKSDYNTDRLISLSPGNYVLELSTWGDNIYTSASIRYFEQFGEKNNYAGGLRIRSIINKDTNGTVVNSKNYEYHSSIDDEKASGRLTSIFKPIYSNETTNYEITFYSVGIDDIPLCNYIEYTTSHYYSNPIANIHANTILYENVRAYSGVDKNANGYTDYKFSFRLNDEITKELPSLETSWKRGELISKKDYKIVSDNDALLIQKTENSFGDFNAIQSQIKAFKLNKYGDVINASCNLRPDVVLDILYAPLEYTYTSKARILNSNSITNYVYDNNNVLTDSLKTTTNYYYGNSTHLQPTQTITATSNNIPIITKIFYPDDITTIHTLGGTPLTDESFNAIAELKKPNIDYPYRLHRIATPIQLETYKDLDEDGIAAIDEILNSQRTLYKDWGSGLVLPEILLMTKDKKTFEERIVYRSYDVFGNPLEVAKVNGIPISYIWGYGHTRPIAKLEGISYEAIDPELISNLQTLSDSDNDELSENALREALHSLRSAYPNATITTFTYDPLVGVTSITDPKGNTTFYSYDAFNRLEQIKDRDRDTLETLDYNYTQDETPQH